MTRLLAALSLAGLLAACGPETLVSTGLGMASLQTTDKTLADHAIGLVTDKDCSSLRAERGDAYCLSDQELQARIPAQPEFCYRTIGGVTCYTKADETKSATRLLY
ncbi:hypothetical protein SAMN06265365_11431 [Tistlia consotensis]|uniref:Lipoprotein n=1 Tax=Tistlia consotensis USBA 355 TaxID=560819 RepID=A0A1Y6B9L8_9PROT|nr:hypothetical protein [Tistlia consotensis]SMF00270.1 hypothetical protein SAMN05428998_102332 [Tistlia consotensis USBA 355]SNR76057.1 hypothetical protein SAMN06265365_11431 [Tistlia consotensis]